MGLRSLWPRSPLVRGRLDAPGEKPPPPPLTGWADGDRPKPVPAAHTSFKLR